MSHAETINADAFRIVNKDPFPWMQGGVVLNPATRCPISALYPPAGQSNGHDRGSGFAGQPFIREMLDKISELKALKEEKGTATSY